MSESASENEALRALPEEGHEEDAPYGALFLAELQRLQESKGVFDYATIQKLKTANESETLALLGEQELQLRGDQRKQLHEALADPRTLAAKWQRVSNEASKKEAAWSLLRAVFLSFGI